MSGRRLVRLVLLLPLLVFGPQGVASAQEVVVVPTRASVTQSVFIANMGGVKPEAVALLYSGGAGEIKLRLENGQPKFNPGNFLIRSRAEFIRSGVLPVLVDVPSDSPAGVSDPYRRSAAQAADARAVIEEVRKRFPGLPVFIVTTSRSTLSAAYLARTLPADELAGVVLSSSMVAPGLGWETISGLEPGTAKVPVLFVHHREDGCRACPYAAAERAARGFALISVKGGNPAKSGPCEPYAAHGYFGREAETIGAIAGWMLKKPFASDIQ
jgi:hypothetical protein